MDDLVRAALDARPSPSGWWRARCPFCELEAGARPQNRNLSIRMATGYYKCWACQESGFLDDVEGTVLEAQMRRAAAADTQNTLETPEWAEPPESFTELGWGEGAESLVHEPARHYLECRHVPERAVVEGCVGACTRGKYRGRIVVPVLVNGKWNGFAARAYDVRHFGGKPGIPYLYPPGMPRGSVVFNQDSLLEETDEPAIIVEGCFDALPHWPNAVAVLGKPSSQHVDLIATARRPVVVALDGDAWREGRALAERLKLRGLKRVSWVRLEPGTDPGNYTPELLQQFVAEALNGQNEMTQID